ncbi:MAG TPA: DMT family transporter [Phycisphaerales bacterium]|nr:DMT family transporter [Phycisphaerales bacterium]
MSIPPAQQARPNAVPDPSLGPWMGIATLLTALLGWSSVPLFLKHFSHVIDPWTSNGWRYGFSALIWAPVLVHGLRKRSLPPNLWTLAVVPSLFNCLGQVCFTWAHYKINPGLLTFGLRTQIIFVAAGAAMLFPAERRVIRSPGFVLGVLLVLAGAAGVIAFGHDNLMEGASALGIALAIAAGLFFAGYALAVRKYMHTVRPLTAFAAISLYTAIAMIAVMPFASTDPISSVTSLDGMQLFWLFFSSFIGIALGHVCYYIAIARLGVAVSSGIIQLQPIIVATASFFIFDERLTALQWAFGAVAIAGAAVILLMQHLVKRAEAGRGQAAPDRAPTADTEEYGELPVDIVVAAAACEREASGGANSPAR